jgi:hypothetical protein
MSHTSPMYSFVGASPRCQERQPCHRCHFTPPPVSSLCEQPTSDLLPFSVTLSYAVVFLMLLGCSQPLPFCSIGERLAGEASPPSVSFCAAAWNCAGKTRPVVILRSTLVCIDASYAVAHLLAAKETCSCSHS